MDPQGFRPRAGSSFVARPLGSEADILTLLDKVRSTPRAN